MSGKLLLVGTPLGNLGDFPPRAVEALKSADLILCEDTRHSRKLLTHFGIDKPADSYHDHNEEEKAPQIIERIEKGETIALIAQAVDAERHCCRFLRFGITVEPDGGPVFLDLTGPSGTRDFVNALLET